MEAEIVEKIKVKRMKKHQTTEISEAVLERIRVMIIDHEIGTALLKSLKDYTTDELKSYMRLVLNDTDIDDVERDHRAAAEIRHGWIQKVIKLKGHGLTPKYLFSLDHQHQIFRDKMIDIFINKLESFEN